MLLTKAARAAGQLSLVLAGVAALLPSLSFAAPQQYDLNARASSHVMEPRQAADSQIVCGKRSIGYYVNWAIYARKYEVSQVPVEQLTHVHYAFANVHNVTGEVYLTDEFADIQRKSATDKNETGVNIYGNIKQFLLLKKQHRNLKLILSIGGWTYSKNLTIGLSTENGRKQFASSATMLVQNYGFDGLDIDYEWANTTEKVTNLVATLKLTREALDDYAVSIGLPKNQFLLSFAAPAGPQNYKQLDFPGLDRYLDYWNLMAYDYAGPTFEDTRFTGHDANWYPSKDIPEATPYSTQAALDYYLAQGLHSDKIVIGNPLYGRAFPNTDGLGKTFSGNVSAGSWEPGVYDFKALPLAGAVVQEDDQILASWSYDKDKRELVSFDNVKIGELKAQKVNELNLGGLMWWETSGDRNGSDSLIAAQSQIIKAKGLEQRPNVIAYPKSVFDNVRGGFPGE